MDRRNTTYSSKPNHAARRAHRQAKIKYPTYDTSLIRPQKKHRFLFVIFAVVILAIVVFVGFSVYSCVVNKQDTIQKGQSVEVTIEEGSSVKEIASILYEAGVISDTSEFIDVVNSKDSANTLKAGTYVLEGGKSVEEYVDNLCDGPDATSPKVVVTEGMTLKNIANEVEKSSQGRISAQQFKNVTQDASKYVKDFSFLKNAGKNSLEGFLFPKTYSINTTLSAEDLVYMMLEQFELETENLDYTIPASYGLNDYETLILASIVEKESTPEFASKVASVFYNRLKDGIPLNSDATTAYEVGHDPSPEEVHRDSKYSTYSNDGLVPTPICSPSKETLEVVCNPEVTDYYYFYFKEIDGELKYKFSETYEQHQDAIDNM